MTRRLLPSMLVGRIGVRAPPFGLRLARGGYIGMRRTALLLASMGLAVLLASGAALALPSETPDETPMLNGPVRTIAEVGPSAEAFVYAAMIRLMVRRLARG